MANMSRVFHFMLFVNDSISCTSVIHRLTQFFDKWAYIIHDQDDDAFRVHYHFIGRCRMPHSAFRLAELFEIPSFWVVPVRNFDNNVRYLVDFDDLTNEPRYYVSDIRSNFNHEDLFKINRSAGK